MRLFSMSDISLCDRIMRDLARTTHHGTDEHPCAPPDHTRTDGHALITHRILSAAVSAAPDLLLTHPVEVRKAMLQQGRIRSLLSYCASPQYWYTGVQWRAAAYVPMRTIFWSVSSGVADWCDDTIDSSTSSSTSSVYHSVYRPLLRKVGVTSLATVAAQAPFEIAMDTRYTWAVHAKASGYKSHVPPRLFMGVVPQLARNLVYCNVLFGGVYTYQAVHGAHHQTNDAEEGDTMEKSHVPFPVTVACGVAASGAGHYFDTWKTRVQSSPLPELASLVKHRPPVLCRDTYRGFMARMLSSGIAMGVGYAVFQSLFG